jgi:hypothetical protein
VCKRALKNGGVEIGSRFYSVIIHHLVSTTEPATSSGHGELLLVLSDGLNQGGLHTARRVEETGKEAPLAQRRVPARVQASLTYEYEPHTYIPCYRPSTFRQTAVRLLALVSASTRTQLRTKLRASEGCHGMPAHVY